MIVMRMAKICADAAFPTVPGRLCDVKLAPTLRRFVVEQTKRRKLVHQEAAGIFVWGGFVSLFVSSLHRGV